MLHFMSAFLLYKRPKGKESLASQDLRKLLEESPMKKRILAALLASATLISIAGCESTASTSTPASTGGETSTADSTGGTESTGGDAAQDAGQYIHDITLADGEGKKLNIYAWNEDWKKQFDQYVKPHLPADVEVEFIINPNEGNAYQNKLDTDLPLNADKDANEKIDMFLFEADYATKYVDTQYTVDVKELGITDDDISAMYQYTTDVAKDSAGALKALSWQATPGLFAYRRDIAKDVLGTDDPEEVQAALADWDKFEEVAQKAKDKGYFMLSGYDDTYRTFSGNATKPWVDADNNIQVPDELMAWVDQTKDYTDKGYNNKTTLWSDAWSADQAPGGKVFGFFYSTWGINFTLSANSLEKAVKDGGKEEVGNGEYGKWAVCYGPKQYFWGGTWMAAAAGTDNPKLVGSIMKEFCCNPEFGKAFAEETNDYYNDVNVMKEISSDPDYGSEFLGGQNHYALFYEIADDIVMANCTKYDQGCNEDFQSAMHDYFNGTIASKDVALNTFYGLIKAKYPDVKVPDTAIAPPESSAEESKAE